MRRIIIITTALVVLGAAAAAYAQSTANTYTAKFTFNQSGAGSAKKPVAVGFNEVLTAANATAGQRAAPLTQINITIPGVKVTEKGFPTCSPAKILAAKSDSVCPKGSEVGVGTVTAALGPSDLTQPGTPCNPILDIWNGGGGQLVYFFVISGTHQCGGLQTGSTAPWLGSAVNKGKDLVEDTTLPADVSTDAGNIGAYGSLTLESIKWLKATIKVKGKTVPFFESTGCTKGSHAYSVAFTATDAAGETLTGSASGAGKC